MQQQIRRAAIYARYSTELQSDKSCEDQIALCRQMAERETLNVVAEYRDAAKSGASLHGRDGLARLEADAARGAFEVVIVESLDRLSRDMEDLAGLHKRFNFRGIEIRAVNEGTVDTVVVGLRGLVGQLFREDGAKKVRRGMAGVVRSGRSAGGRAYGYRPVQGRPGDLEIVEEEAAVIRRIFRDYAGGVAPRTIAARLNVERIAPPRGDRWNASTLNGNYSRGHGLLLNPIYGGQRVWNRVRMIKDPATGKRVSRVNPKSEWQIEPAEELRIVDGEIFEAAQARKRASSHGARGPIVRKRTLLSGLLRCGKCGGGMSICDKRRGPEPDAHTLLCRERKWRLREWQKVPSA